MRTDLIPADAGGLAAESTGSNPDTARLSDIDAAAEYARAVELLRRRLGPAGWTVSTTRKGVNASWRWLRVDLRFRPKSDPAQPWRSRVKDGFPRLTVFEHRSADPMDALTRSVDYALAVEEFCVGRGLFSNPSKSYLGHRLWQAIRPTG